MRIVGGMFRGARLKTPTGSATRPTTDRVRENLFNILSNRVQFEGIRVLDVFAGTGALGLEALSRGAGFCLFVDHSKPAISIIKSNIDHLNLADQSKVSKNDATRLGAPGETAPFDLVFADPPYGKELGTKAAISLGRSGWLNDNAIFILEEEISAMPEVIDNFEKLDTRTYGGTALGLFKFQGQSNI